MPIDLTDLRPTITPKSDQLNAEQLLGGDMVITVTEVRASESGEQPVSIHYENDQGRPFKPCKTMRKVLVFAWSENAHNWVGRSMQLFNDPSVKFGGVEVGGIRIRALSHIDKPLQMNLTSTKGKKSAHRIDVLSGPSLDEVRALIEGATGKADMDRAKQKAAQLLSASDRDQARAIYAAKVAALKAAKAGSEQNAA